MGELEKRHVLYTFYEFHLSGFEPVYFGDVVNMLNCSPYFAKKYVSELQKEQLIKEKAQGLVITPKGIACIEQEETNEWVR